MSVSRKTEERLQADQRECPAENKDKSGAGGDDAEGAQGGGGRESSPCL